MCDLYMIKKHCLRHFHDLKHYGVIVYKRCKIVNTFINIKMFYLSSAFQEPNDTIHYVERYRYTVRIQQDEQADRQTEIIKHIRQ